MFFIFQCPMMDNGKSLAVAILNKLTNYKSSLTRLTSIGIAGAPADFTFSILTQVKI
jgi:hypothetical protein